MSANTPIKGTIVIAGGGTGGHLIPGLAVASELTRMGARRIVFVGTARGIETRLVPAAGYELQLIEVGGLNRSSRRRQIATLTALPRAILASRRILRDTRAAVVLGIGGYASGPVLAAAGLTGVPLVVLEVNARTGMANRLAARWVHTAAVNFPQTAADFPRARTLVTGIPVRASFFAIPPLQSKPGPLAVLVFGGSQGASRLNQVVAEWAQGTAGTVVHQTGSGDYEAVAARYASLGPRVRATAFIDDMAGAMAAADLIICRSGASTLGELAAAGRPALLVPFPGAADNHQLINAQAYAAAGAAIVVEQSALTPAHLQAQIATLTAERRDAMAQTVRTFAHPQAATAIATAVLEA